MSVQRTKNIFAVSMEPGAIFADAITTGYIELNNYKYVDFLVCSGVGTAADTTVTFKGKGGADGTAKTIPFARKVGNSFTPVSATGDTLSIGGTAGECGKATYRIDADALAKEGLDRVSLNTTAVASSTVPGAILVCLYEPRYSE